MSAGRLMPPGGASPPLDGVTPVFEEMGADPRVLPGADRPPGSIARTGTLYLEKVGTAATAWEPIGPEVNGISAGSTFISSGTLQFSNSNGVSFGISGQTLTASIAAGTATGNFGGVAGGTQTATSGTVVFSNSNNVSFGLSGSSVMTASASFAQTTQPAINAAAGTQTATSGTVVFSNSNGVSFGMSGSSRITASANSAAIQAGTQTGTSGTIVFSNSNNVSFGMSGSSVVTASASFAAQTTQPAVNAAAGTQTATSGTVVFSNSNNITFGMSGSSQVTASFSVTAGQGVVTVSQWEPFNAADLNATTLGDIQLFIQREHVPIAISATRANFIIDISNSSSAGGSLTIRFGVYTMSGSTASLASSASRTFGYNSTAANSSYTAVSGWRYRSMTLGGGTWALTPGDYLFGAVVSISTSGTSGTYSWKARRNLPLDVVEFGTAGTAPYFFHGSYNTVTGGLPNSFQLSDVVIASGGNAADENDHPWFHLLGTF